MAVTETTETQEENKLQTKMLSEETNFSSDKVKKILRSVHTTPKEKT